MLKQQVASYATESRGKRSTKAPAHRHAPGTPVRSPVWKHRAQLQITGLVELHRLEKGVSRQAALFLGVTLRDAWQAARCKSMGHEAGKADVTCPLLPACFPSSALARAGGQRTRSAAAAGTDSDKALTTGTSSFSWVLLYLPADPPTPRIRTTAPGSCSGRLQPEIRCLGLIFPIFVYSSHSFQQEREKS